MPHFHTCILGLSDAIVQPPSVCRFLHGRNLSTATVEDFNPIRCSATFVPHIYSPTDVLLLLEVARNVPVRPSNPLRPKSLELIVALLYTTGLRIGAAVRLRMQDYDGSDGTLTIRETKFAKSRLVPLSQSMRELLESYLRTRSSLGLSCQASDSLIWPLRWTPARPEPSLGSIQVALSRLLRQSGLKRWLGRGGPRIHDFRHSFAANRVLQW